MSVEKTKTANKPAKRHVAPKTSAKAAHLESAKRIHTPKTKEHVEATKHPHAEPVKVSHSGKYIEAVGRRKSAIARVRIFPKASYFEINGVEYKKYFPFGTWQSIVESPFTKTEPNEKYGVSVKVSGGGMRGQAEAVRHGISRALVSIEEGYRKRLKKLGYLKRDPRVKERRKYGLKKARRAPQWAKR